MPTLGVDDFLRAVNPTDERLDVVGIVFEAGQSKVVSFPWMSNQYGDPRSTGDTHQVIRAADGTSALIQSRTNELLKVNRFWNIGSGPSFRTWEEIPPLEFYTMDGERVYTVYDDPTGNHTSLATTTVNEQAALVETIQRQQSQINKLLEISGLTHEAIPNDEPSDLPQDESTSIHTTSPWAEAEPVGDGIPL